MSEDDQSRLKTITGAIFKSPVTLAYEAVDVQASERHPFEWFHNAILMINYTILYFMFAFLLIFGLSQVWNPLGLPEFSQQTGRFLGYFITGPVAISVLMHFKFLILSVASVRSHQMEETDVAWTFKRARENDPDQMIQSQDTDADRNGDGRS